MFKPHRNLSTYTKNRSMSFIRSTATRVSRAICRSPRTMFALQQGWIKFGYKALDLWGASWSIRRHEWLIAKSKGTPTPLEPELQLSPTPDATMAARIIALYRKAATATGGTDALIPETSMWGHLRQAHYAPFRKLVEQGDPLALAHYLQKLFRTETVNGYAYGTVFDNMPHRWHYVPVAIELSVVTLAESLGILRAECHEQGAIAHWRSQMDEAELMRRLDAAVGFRIEAPRFGDPRGILFGGRFLVRETCSHIYSAYRMRAAINRASLEGPLDLVEIGGGYGGTCYWLRKLLGERARCYAIVDLPEVNLVQAFFLGSAEPGSVVLFGEQTSGSPARPVQLIPHFALEEIAFRPHVLINQDSMPEMPESEVERYLTWASRSVDGLFLSFNQEAYAPWGGTPQVLVPEVASRFPALERLSRETSWDRRGYVEEVYRVPGLQDDQQRRS